VVPERHKMSINIMLLFNEMKCSCTEPSRRSGVQWSETTLKASLPATSSEVESLKPHPHWQL